MNISTADILKWDKELRDTVLDSVRNVMWYKLYEQYYLPKFWKKKIWFLYTCGFKSFRSGIVELWSFQNYQDHTEFFLLH